jgi:hypothetical protein
MFIKLSRLVLTFENRIQIVSKNDHTNTRLTCFGMVWYAQFLLKGTSWEPDKSGSVNIQNPDTQ